MRHLRVALVALAAGLVSLAYAWRVALLGAAPDLLFVMTAVCAFELRPAARTPVACCLGLWSDFLTGGRLGPMALGYGLGAKAVEILTPLSWHARGRWPVRILSRAASVFVATLAGALAAHVAAALIGAAAGDGAGGIGPRLARAAGIAVYTGACAPLAWPLVALAAGRHYQARAGSPAVTDRW